ncbi:MULTISPECIES: ABC transporter permease [Azorhizobium]|uniref:ABC transporter permease protein n=1 Tax=Azorhizobium caulinodans (strain ATCC 43989 / DSM 5975 / JCM 20966 / LMG 6465 / NBRC 14845 / NCIMB 13405 / ORS 571) TaxID=438753 RepID=A8I6Y1_AZOC5|nr:MULTISPECIES: ABC transporter permease [Azorhizobium]TDT99260.1 putative hydroxymethylpyrimidine transport system permease protein [Azorhizobium sp. AG788]BAF88055.1 ABC transporter permease protein [Azorhizobium caulinodans ORS 571]
MTRRFAGWGRGLLTTVGLIGLWWLIAVAFALPPYILPTPPLVAQALWNGRFYLAGHAATTALEIGLGLFFGVLMGASVALAMAASPVVQRWLTPLIVVSQAIPVFALAPILVLWLGFGLASKVMMAVLIIFFPVAATFHDGLRRTEPGWLDLARTMRASRAAELRHIRLMAALPALGSGLRVAAAVAPIGAVIGEWVGAAGGLGYVMLNANARMQTALCFAALFILAVMAVALWQLVDVLLRRILYWVPDAAAARRGPD